MMRARPTSWLLLGLAASLPLASDATAQLWPPSRFAAAAPASHPGHPLATAFADSAGSRHVSAVLLGGAGAALGFFTGAFLGAALYRLSGSTCGCEDPGLGVVLTGALVGFGTGAGLGVHVGNAGRGSLSATLATALGATVALGLLSVQMELGPLVLGTPVAVLALASAVRFTTEEPHGAGRDSGPDPAPPPEPLGP